MNFTRDCSDKLKTLKKPFSYKILDIRPPPFLLIEKII